jgi:hypothetical protein
MYICMYVCLCVCTHTHTHIYIYIVCIYIYIYIYTHTHIHTYIHTQTGLKDNLQPDDSIERDVSVDPQELISSLKEILSMGVRHLGEWLESPEAGIAALQSGGAYVPVPYVVQSQPVSLRELFYACSCKYVCIWLYKYLCMWMGEYADMHIRIFMYVHV